MIKSRKEKGGNARRGTLDGNAGKYDIVRGAKNVCALNQRM
ncbi:MAG: hypothetical protein PUB98_06300 [Clostridiales bacterium]|nr:hypothetical protein [Clostridiales bacterium]